MYNAIVSVICYCLLRRRKRNSASIIRKLTGQRVIVNKLWSTDCKLCFYVNEGKRMWAFHGFGNYFHYIFLHELEHWVRRVFNVRCAIWTNHLFLLILLHCPIVWQSNSFSFATKRNKRRQTRYWNVSQSFFVFQIFTPFFWCCQ